MLHGAICIEIHRCSATSNPLSAIGVAPPRVGFRRGGRGFGRAESSTACWQSLYCAPTELVGSRLVGFRI